MSTPWRSYGHARDPRLFFRAPARSLDRIVRGDRVQVGRVVFNLVRARCWEWGLREGDVVSCRDVYDGEVFLIRSDGRPVRIPKEYARFIEILPTELAEGARRPSGPPAQSLDPTKTLRKEATKWRT